MQDDELVEKVARRMSDEEWFQSKGNGNNPDNQPGTLLLAMARAAIAVMREAGWKGPPNKDAARIQREMQEILERQSQRRSL